MALHVIITPAAQGMAICKTSIVGLDVVVELHHLTPPARPKHPKYVSHILGPPIAMDAASHHSWLN